MVTTSTKLVYKSQYTTLGQLNGVWLGTRLCNVLAVIRILTLVIIY